MKTYEEAVALVMARKVKDINEMPTDIIEASERYQSLHEEIQSSFQAKMLAATLLALGEDQKVEPIRLLCIAFSHGVAVGVEMEKQDA